MWLVLSMDKLPWPSGKDVRLISARSQDRIRDFREFVLIRSLFLLFLISFLELLFVVLSLVFEKRSLASVFNNGSTYESKWLEIGNKTSFPVNNCAYTFCLHAQSWHAQFLKNSNKITLSLYGIVINISNIMSEKCWFFSDLWFSS